MTIKDELNYTKSKLQDGMGLYVYRACVCACACACVCVCERERERCFLNSSAENWKHSIFKDYSRFGYLLINFSTAALCIGIQTRSQQAAVMSCDEAVGCMELLLPVKILKLVIGNILESQALGDDDQDSGSEEEVSDLLCVSDNSYM